MKLTIIIPSRNETDLPNTLESLYAHSKGRFEVIVVNDWTDTDKWTEPKKRRNMKVIRPAPFSGFGGSIQAGVDIARSENIYICGARTRFSEGWIENTIRHINEEPETLFCVTNQVLEEKDGELVNEKGMAYGAIIKYFDQEHWFKYLINLRCAEEPGGEEVDCAYGGSYAMKKAWWEKIRGLDMIRTRGGCNQFLSLKTWMAGGKVKVMKDVIVGNIYREYCSYPCGYDDLLFNRCMIMGVLWGMDRAVKVMWSYKGYREFELLRRQLMRQYGAIALYHKYMKSIQKASINHHLIF